jgi:hypothetical protein
MGSIPSIFPLKISPHPLINSPGQVDGVCNPVHHSGRVVPFFLSGQPHGCNQTGTQIDDLARCFIALSHRNTVCEQMAKVNPSSAVLLEEKSGRRSEAQASWFPRYSDVCLLSPSLTAGADLAGVM